ncbi:hypothetical protein HDV00_003975 [Rhizophlyctis rosea]|nr:hypothetical protein HDV00_003975 [Rhizophlyctis rosea]
MFKTLLLMLDENARAKILVRMMTGTNFIGINVAAVSILKDFVHAAMGSNRNSSPKRPSLFASPFLTETFLAKLTDLSENFYKSQVIPSNNILNDDETFFERHPLIMHVLNFYYYLLLRDPVRGGKLKVWTIDSLDRTTSRFLSVLRQRCAQLRQSVQEATHRLEQPDETSSSAEERGDDGDTLQELGERLMALDMTEMVLDRISGKVKIGRTELMEFGE